MDPVSIIATALLEGVIAATRDVSSQAVKDGYKSLVTLVQNKFGKSKDLSKSLAELDEKSSTEERLNSLEQELESVGVSSDNEVLNQALALLNLLTKICQNVPNPDYGVFIDRERELSQILRILRPYPFSQHSLVTISGIGGIGKSALALEIAHRYLRDYHRLPIEERFEAIIWFSAKSSVLTGIGIFSRKQTSNTLEDLYTTIAITSGSESITRARPAEQNELVNKALTQQRTLLIVDNLETVEDERIYTFLQELPAPTKAIATTRNRVDVAYPIQLSGMTWGDARELIRQECLKKNVQLTEEEFRLLFERTGGVPLAIVWSIAQLGLGYGLDAALARLDEPTDDISRYCFEKALEHIHNRDSYKLLLILAVLPSDTSRGMLGEIAGLNDDYETRDQALAELEKLSLVNRQGDLWNVLPLVRQYMLRTCTPEVRDQYLLQVAECYSKFVSKNVSDERVRSARRFGYDALEAERLNIFGLIDWCYERELWELVVKLVLGLGYFPHARGYWLDATKYWELGANAAHIINDQLVFARCTTYLGYMYFFQGDIKNAEKFAQRATLVLDQTKPSYQLASILRLKSYLAKHHGDEQEAIKFLKTGLVMMREVKNPSGTSKVLNDLGELVCKMGNYDEAEHYLNESLSMSEALDDWAEITRALRHLGRLAFLRNHIDEARMRYQESLKIAKDIGWRDEIGYISLELAKLEWQCGNRQLAIDLAHEVLDIAGRLGQNAIAGEVQEMLSILKNAHT